MKFNYMIVIHAKSKFVDTIYNQYATTLEDLKEKLNELEKYEKVLHIWKIKEVNLK